MARYISYPLSVPEVASLLAGEHAEGCPKAPKPGENALHHIMTQDLTKPCDCGRQASYERAKLALSAAYSMGLSDALLDAYRDHEEED